MGQRCMETKGPADPTNSIYKIKIRTEIYLFIFRVTQRVKSMSLIFLEFFDKLIQKNLQNNLRSYLWFSFSLVSLVLVYFYSQPM